MIRALGITFLVLLTQCDDSGNAAGGEGELPSGLTHELQDVVFEPQGAHMGAVRVVRVRFVQPALVGEDAISFEKLEPDFQHLCDTEGLAQKEKSAPNAQEIIISIASAPVAFGETAPDVVQYIDAFTVENGACIWAGL